MDNEPDTAEKEPMNQVTNGHDNTEEHEDVEGQDEDDATTNPYQNVSVEHNATDTEKIERHV